MINIIIDFFFATLFFLVIISILLSGYSFFNFVFLPFFPYTSRGDSNRNMHFSELFQAFPAIWNLVV